DIVVGPYFEPDHHVELRRLPGNHDYRDVRLAAEGATDVDPRHVWKHDVEQNDVGSRALEESQSFLASARDDDMEALALQTDGQRVDEGRLVFDQEDYRR